MNDHDAILQDERYLEYLRDFKTPEGSADETDPETEKIQLNQSHRLSLECRGENNHRFNNLI